MSTEILNAIEPLVAEDWRAKRKKGSIQSPDRLAAASSAISLRRIADALEKLAEPAPVSRNGLSYGIPLKMRLDIPSPEREKLERDAQNLIGPIVDIETLTEEALEAIIQKARNESERAGRFAR